MLRLLLALAVCASVAAPAAAQFGYRATNSNSNMYSQRAWQRVQERTLQRPVLRSAGYTDEQIAKMSADEYEAAYQKAKQGLIDDGSGNPAAKPQQTPKKPAGPPATRYTPTGKRIVLEDMVKAMGSNKQEQDGLRLLFKAGLKEFETAAKDAKMENDLAFAMAFFVATSYMLDGEEVEDKAVLVLADAIQDIFDQPEMRKSSSEEKQAFAEFLAIMGTFLLASKEHLDPETDKESLEGLKEAARGVLKQYLKLDQTQYKLTPDGLAKKGQISNARDGTRRRFDLSVFIPIG